MPPPPLPQLVINEPRRLYIPDPISWEDEAALKSAGLGLELRTMRFLDQRGMGVDWSGMREDLGVSLRSDSCSLAHKAVLGCQSHTGYHQQRRSHKGRRA